MKIKTCPARIKAAGVHEGTDDGQFQAIVATYDLDSVGDRIVPGAFKDTLAEWATTGDPIPVYWSHRMDDPSMNIGQVIDAQETDKGLQVTAQLDMDNPTAVQVYKLLKGRRVTQFSFAYDVEDGAFVEQKDASPFYELRKLRLYEVGPTPIGANQATELLEVKTGNRPVTIQVHGADSDDAAAIAQAVNREFAAKGALPVSSGPKDTSDAAWDGPKNEANLSTSDGADVYKQAYAWVDPDGNPQVKASYKFIHHEVSSDGKVGAANIKACTTGIGVLNGGRGGTTIPAGDVQGVYNHLAAHIKAAGGEPPELSKRATAAAKDMLAPAAAAVDADDDPKALIASVDACLDEAVNLLSGVDTGSLPPEVQQALGLVVGAEGLIDDVMDLLGIPDADDDEETEKHGRATRKVVRRNFLPRKEGRRNSAMDTDTIQSIHDAASKLGASCPTADEGKATPGLSAATEEPDGAKADRPAEKGTASTRLRTELDLMEAEVSLYT